MKKIDRETVQRILDTVDIVEVVGDFVSLKKRGANYIGLCPFHPDRSPSFSVSKARGYCKCFSCGKGGDAVGFLREHENMSYYEALRYLAKKYNIEIKEHEVSEEEQKADLERESMFAINEWAMQRFNKYLTSTPEGRDVGMAYFLERGLNEATIERFKLGYCPETNGVLSGDALSEGYSEKYLIDTGLCYKNETTGRLVDKFRGRVIFPVFTTSGKVVAFGARTLSSDKKIAKYLNSPESLIYKKKNELYGLYQARGAIKNKKCCILVEGYMDVLSMSQSGIENVVASSGTSLTDGQIKLIHRLTDDVILMYDSDQAGIKAALRGVDLLLADDLNISIVLLPDGDDPDSFAQNHSLTEIEEYIKENTRDFIKFKAQFLLGQSKDNPMERANAINEILRSISLIKDKIKREVYCQECSRIMGMREEVLRRELGKIIHRRIEEEHNARERERAQQSVDELISESDTTKSQLPEAKQSFFQKPATSLKRRNLKDCEKEVLRYIVRYGFLDFCDAIDENGETRPMNVLDFIESDLTADEIHFSDDVNRTLYEQALSERENWIRDREAKLEEINRHKEELTREGVEEIKLKAQSINDIASMEEKLKKEIEAKCADKMRKYACRYLEKKLLASENDEVSSLALQLVAEKHVLSRYHTKFTQLPTEIDKLQDLIVMALNSWKNMLVELKIKEIMQKLEEASAQGDSEAVMELIKRKVELDRQKSEFALLLGERVFGPPSR